MNVINVKYVRREMMDLGGETESVKDSSLEAVSATGCGEAEDRLEDVLKSLSKVDKLSPEQVSLCQFRHMLLCYLDRLSTYKVKHPPSP